MITSYFSDIKMSHFHTGKTPYLTLDDGIRSRVVAMDDAAALAGVARQTLVRWCDGTQRPPGSALRLFQVVYLGVMPWLSWDPFRMIPGSDGRHIMIHDQIRQHWTPERILMIAHGYDRAAELERTLATLRATVTALSTRQPPPIPCAEIIHFPQAKKSPA